MSQPLNRAAVLADIDAEFPGTWGLTFQGDSSHNQAVIFFCVNP